MGPGRVFPRLTSRLPHLPSLGAYRPSPSALTPEIRFTRLRASLGSTGPADQARATGDVHRCPRIGRHVAGRTERQKSSAKRGERSAWSSSRVRESGGRPLSWHARNVVFHRAMTRGVRVVGSGAAGRTLAPRRDPRPCRRLRPRRHPRRRNPPHQRHRSPVYSGGFSVCCDG